MGMIYERNNFTSYLVVSCSSQGRKEEAWLDLIWRHQVQFSTIYFSSNHIIGYVRDSRGGEWWFLSSYYEFPKEQNKIRTWQLVHQISYSVWNRWLNVRYFNDTLITEYKFDSNPKNPTPLSIRRQVVETCGLFDMKVTDKLKNSKQTY